jgi:hypothetical protein
VINELVFGGDGEIGLDEGLECFELGELVMEWDGVTVRMVVF